MTTSHIACNGKKLHDHLAVSNILIRLHFLTYSTVNAPSEALNRADLDLEISHRGRPFSPRSPLPISPFLSLLPLPYTFLPFPFPTFLSAIP